MTDEQQNLDQLYIQVMKFRKKFRVYEVAALMLDINPQNLVLHPLQTDDSTTKRTFYVVKNKGDYLKTIESGDSKPIQLDDKHPVFVHLKKAICDAISYEEIFTDESLDNYHERIQRDELKHADDHIMVAKQHVEKWTKENNFQCSFFNPPTQPEELPDYLDKNNPEHSIELGIAIEAWQRFAGMGITHPKAYIEKWLNDDCIHTISKEAISRIVMLVNWNQKGGVKTEAFKQAVYEQALQKDLSPKKTNSLINSFSQT